MNFMHYTLLKIMIIRMNVLRDYRVNVLSDYRAYMG
jgi:hypothetical protein